MWTAEPAGARGSHRLSARRRDITPGLRPGEVVANLAPCPGARPGPSPGAVLALQRLAGNRAAAYAVQRSCPQGKQRRVVHDDCAPGGPANPRNFIRLLTVSLSARRVTAEWGPRTGRAIRRQSWTCTPNPAHTPTDADVVGTKCTVNHTNMQRDGMAWFTGFQSQGLRIGFHDSQPVGAGFVSHGCIRVVCDVAALINRNTWSGVTRIEFV